MTPLETLKKEGREEFRRAAVVLTQADAEEIVDRGGDSEPFLYLRDILADIDTLIDRIYLAALEAAEGAMPKERIDDGGFTESGLHGIWGFNESRKQALAAITELKKNA